MGKKFLYIVVFLLFLSLFSSGCNILLGTTPGSISGTVTDAGSGNPIFGATVLTDPPTETKTTNSDGKFTLADINDGDYTVTATAVGYDSASVTVTVISGAVAQADIKLTQSLPIFTGTVKRGDDGTPLSGIKVTVKTGNDTTQEYSSSTASDGSFFFRRSDIPEGELNPYPTFVDTDGYEYQRTLVFLKEATSNTTFDFRLYPNTVSASISGSVTDFAGNPVIPTSTSFTPQFQVTRDISTETGKQTIVRVDRSDQTTYLAGNYTVAKLAGGAQYTVKVVAPSYLSREATVTFSPNSINVSHDFTLRVVLSQVKPIPNEAVDAPPVFEWQVDTRVDHYILRVASGPIEVDEDTGSASTSATFLWESPNTSPAAGDTTLSLTYGGTNPLVSGATYYWQVFAYDGADQFIGVAQSSWKFSIK